MKKMISVIMATYKEPENQLRQAIESILNQTYQNIEFIIILDYPENQDHKDIIQEYMNKDTRVKFFINEKNMGLPASLNRGLSYTQGDYIARMDADDISLPNRLEKQLNYLVKNNFDLIGGITQMIDEQGNVIYSIKSIPTDEAKIKKVLKYGQCIAHPTWLGKKEVFERLEGYRNIPLCEDYDFTLRAILNNFRISNLNEIVLKYRMTENSLSRSNLYEQYLFMVYITNQYSLGKISNIEEAKAFVKKNNVKSKSDNYLKANVIFNRMLKAIENKKLLSFIKDGFQLLFTSKSYLNKIYRFLMLSLNS